MSFKVFEFGQLRPEYAVPVLNERAVRASAGILFALALVSFMNAWLLGHFGPTRVFVVAFLIEFSLRLFVNPRLAPVMVLGEWMVRQQRPESTGAPQKRFAWGLGLLLGLAMLYLMVFNRYMGPLNMLICGACLLLMFFETAFGICLGCKVYEWVVRKPPELCPGGVCAVEPDPRVQPRWSQALVAAVYGVVVGLVAQHVYRDGPDPMPAARPMSPAAAAPVDPAEAERCQVPAFAKAIGHAEMWKLHNNCK